MSRLTPDELAQTLHALDNAQAIHVQGDSLELSEWQRGFPRAVRHVVEVHAEQTAARYMGRVNTPEVVERFRSELTARLRDRLRVLRYLPTGGA